MAKIKKQFTVIKGMHDILPEDFKLFAAVKSIIDKFASFYNFSPIETPVLESLELFERSSGQSTEVVQKQMFSLLTKGGDALAVRPEGTPGIVRAYIEHGLSHAPHPLKLYYYGYMFRYEKPQAGRYRQFHQAGFEIFSNEIDPIYDVQAILTSDRILEAIGIKNLTVQINSIGDKNCRPPYLEKLIKYYKSKSKLLCADCKERLKKNPLRLLDCKEDQCQELKLEAPKLLDFLDSNCRNHFRRVLEYLEDLHIPYMLNTSLVRGLDYYTKTVFEITAEGLDASLAGGGRYDYLAELLGGRKTPAVGVAIGIERVIEIIKAHNINLPMPKVKSKIFISQIGEAAKKKALSLIEDLRNEGILVAEALGKDSLRAQMKMADRYGADIGLILGQREVYEETIIVRDLKSGVQETVPLKRLAEELKKRLKTVGR